MLGIEDRQSRIDRLNAWLRHRDPNRQVASTNELTQAEAKALIDTLEKQLQHQGGQK
jgi:hypothetical protein